MIIVDTCVWSQALRREPKHTTLTSHLQELIQTSRVQMLGIVRQELLSGIPKHPQFDRVSRILESFPDLLADTQDHVKAAELFNLCRSRGVQGSHNDFLICALSLRHSFPIFTCDRDFENYSRIFPLQLHSIPQ